jgi:hypothetical protein
LACRRKYKYKIQRIQQGVKGKRKREGRWKRGVREEERREGSNQQLAEGKPIFAMTSTP